MKKLLYLGLALLASATFAHATITINLGAGNLYGTSTATLFPAGGLLQLIVSSTDNVFSAPVAGSYTGNSADDIILASFTTLTPGTFQQVINFALSGNIGPGDQILLRWFPTLTLADTTPPAGAPFGQFRTDLIENFSDIPWNLPNDGAIVGLNFLTMAQGGTRMEIEGVANMMVAIPEPSTIALLGLSVVGLAAYSRRRKS
jgi:hypothetical protein